MGVRLQDQSLEAGAVQRVWASVGDACYLAAVVDAVWSDVNWLVFEAVSCLLPGDANEA